MSCMRVPLLCLTLVSLGCAERPVEATPSQSQTRVEVGEVNSPTPPSTKKGQRPKGKYVTVHVNSKKSIYVAVELATTERQRAKGLMFRKKLARQTGMLFVMDRIANHRFWMKNTLIHLDIIFISPDGEIVGIVENAEPETLTGREVGIPSKYILEIQGGESRQLGIHAGQWVDLSRALSK